VNKPFEETVEERKDRDPEFREELKKERDSIITVTCKLCKEQHEVSADYRDFINWKGSGQVIQKAMPYLTPSERELLISGICEVCWDKMFDNDEEV